MKFKIILIPLIILIISGCSTSSVTCQLNEELDGISINNKVVVNFSNDKPTSATTTLSMKLTDENKTKPEIFNNYTESVKNLYTSFENKNVTVKSSKKNNEFNIEINIKKDGFKDSSNEALAVLGNVNSKKEFIKEKEKNNFVCK